MRLSILLAALPLISACAPMGTAGLAEGRSGECFWGSQVSGFTDAGPDRALVRIGFREAWELTLSPGCPNVDYAMGLGIVSRGSDRICVGQPAELLVPRASGSGSQRCLVNNVRKLSAQEAAAAWGREGK